VEHHDEVKLGAPGEAAYDPDVDALYVRLRRGKVARTITAPDDDGYMVDVDAAGNVLGVERLGVRHDAERLAREAGLAGRP
jgi:uncharacterized protein YuzE